ncbi:MAG: phosphate ABC transporter, permease protein PstA, partial [Candidatus Omnitrophota bacterium]
MNQKIKQKIAFFILFLSICLVIIPIVLLVIFIGIKGLPAINWEFLTGLPKQGMRAGGIFPAIVGTVYLVIGAVLFSLPIGILSAIYLSEYAKENILTRLIRLAIIN